MRLLNKEQQLVFNDENRFKIVSAGRGWGKTDLALYTAVHFAKNGLDVLLFAPNYTISKSCHKNELTEYKYDKFKDNVIVNSNYIKLRNTEEELKFINPDMWGDVLILDEYAFMTHYNFNFNKYKHVLIVSTPKGKNKFYELFIDEKFKSFMFSQPLKKYYKDVNSEYVDQELLAQFI